MKIIPRIICRTVGVAGMGVALADSFKIAKHYSGIGREHAQEEYLQNAYFKTRTTDQVSYSSKAIGEKAFDLRTKNPLPGIGGSAGGYFKGLTYGLGNYLPVIVCSTFALVSKKWPAKLGAVGTAACLLYNVVRQGFGVGKQNPMN